MDKSIRLILNEMENLAVSGAPMQMNTGDCGMIGNSSLAGMAGMSARSSDEGGFTSEEYQLAKEFISSVGGPQRAKDIIEKCVDNYEALEIIPDDGSEAAASAIKSISSTMQEQL